jgi:multiple sugar transport system substrate-binding protein
MKRIAFAMIGATLLALAATSLSAEDAVLNYWCSWGGDSMKWDQWRVAEFTKATGIKVNNQYVEPDGGIQNGKLLAAIAGGNPPDCVVTSAYSQAYSFAAQDSLLPWDPYLADIGLDAGKMMPGFKGVMQYKGKTYLMPQDSNVLFLFYNVKMFKEAGLDPDKPPKTLEELDKYAEKLTKIKGDKVERYGFIPWVDNGGDPFTWSWMFGADLYDPKTNKLDLGSEKMVNVFKWQNAYARKYNPEKIKSFVSGFGGMFTPDHPFMTGKVAMTVTGNWFTNALRIYAPGVEYRVAPIPVPAGGRANSTPLMSNVFIIPAGAKHPELAAKFFKFIISPEINANNFDVWRSIPVADKMFDSVSWTKKGDPAYKVERVLANSPDSGHPALTKVSAELGERLNSLRDAVIYNDKDPKPLLTDLQKRLQAELDKQ